MKPFTTLYKAKHTPLVFHPDKTDADLVLHFDGEDWRKLNRKDAVAKYRTLIADGYSLTKPAERNIILDM